MQGKVVVITGATSGIGQVAAEELAGMGARLVMVGRDKARGEAALQRLQQRGPNVAHSVHYADLSRIGQMKQVAAEIAAAEPRIDVLINNAGALFSSRHVTEDGLELTFALNHVAYFVLTAVLCPRLFASAPARVINVSSHAHRGAKLDFNDLQSANGYGGFKVYGQTKLANILFTRELARRLMLHAVTANVLHPGFVATRFGDESGGLASRIIRLGKSLVAISPQKGAETIVYLASSPEVANASATYFYKCQPIEPSKEARDDTAARRLWDETVKITGLDIPPSSSTSLAS